MIGVRLKNYYIYLLSFAAILFYLPFISKQFISDDWLCLAYSIMTPDNPEIIFQRSIIYGYFRPLSMIINFIWNEIFGVSPQIFSLINFILHALNTLLFWKVLRKFGVQVTICNVCATVFGFYYLTAPVLLWISSSGDLWVTALSFLFVLKAMTFSESPGLLVFARLVIYAIAATLFKESGLVTLGIYFLLIILNKKNPFSRNFMFYSIFMLSLGFIYLFFYFNTRTVIDKEIELGIGAAVNLWYFLGYLVLPISKRAADFIPGQLLLPARVLRIAIASILPLIFIIIMRKGLRVPIFFFIWSAMFLSTVSIFDWNIKIFDLYPERTVSRYMYTAIPGMVAVLTWFLYHILLKRFKNFHLKIALVAVIIPYIAVNHMITKKMSEKFFLTQDLTDNIIKKLAEVSSDLNTGDTLFVLTDNIKETSQVIRSEIHLQAIILVKFSKNIRVEVSECSSSPTGINLVNYKSHIIRWNTSIDEFILSQL